MSTYTRKDLFRLFLGIAIGIFFIALIARNTDWMQLFLTLGSVNAGWIALALAAFSIGYFFRIARWHAMLQVGSPEIRLRACIGPFLASFAANNVLPFRAGDLMRAVAFNKKLGTTTGAVVATLFIERLLDLFMVVSILGGVIFFFDFDVQKFIGIGAGVLLVLALAILFVLLFPRTIFPLIHLVQAIVGRFAPAFGIRFAGHAEKGLATLIMVSGHSLMIRLLGLSVLCWLAEGTVFWCAAMSIPGISVASGAWLALPIGTLATLIPGTPGYVGTFDYFTSTVMTLTGNSIVAATAFAFLVHALLWFPPTITGGLYLIINSFRPKSTQKVKN